MDDTDFKFKLTEKMDKISTDLGDIKITLVKQEENIAHHIYRTALAESRIEKLEDDLDPIKLQQAKTQGIKDLLLFIAKFGSFLIAIAGLVIALVKRFT
jgi:chromosome condensin MukBEF ATPase and DNA-binding subunit MukB